MHRSASLDTDLQSLYSNVDSRLFSQSCFFVQKINTCHVEYFMYCTPPHFYLVYLQHSSSKHVFSIIVGHTVDPDQKPDDLDLQCFQEKDISGFSRTSVKPFYMRYLYK